MLPERKATGQRKIDQRYHAAKNEIDSVERAEQIFWPASEVPEDCRHGGILAQLRALHATAASYPHCFLMPSRNDAAVSVMYGVTTGSPGAAGGWK